MGATTIPDIERIVGDWLRDHHYLDPFDVRVSGELPKASRAHG